MKYINRELSWLSFNYRVLQEAADPSLPLYERIKFLGIFSSNLDEFYRVKVASLKNIQQTATNKIRELIDFSPQEVLQQIYTITSAQQQEMGDLFRRVILPELESQGIILYQGTELLPVHAEEVSQFFDERLRSFIITRTIQEGDQQNHALLESNRLYFVCGLESNSGNQDCYAWVNIPSDRMQRFLPLSNVDGRFYFVMLDDIIRFNLGKLFPGYTVKFAYSIKLNRDEDIIIDDEFSGNLVEKVRKQIEKRKSNPPVRILYDSAMPEEVKQQVARMLQEDESNFVAGGKYHNWNDMMKLPNPLKPALQEEESKPILIRELEDTKDLLELVAEKDFFINIPYQSYSPVIRFFKEAATNPEVTEVKATLYRMANPSEIAYWLMEAAKAGKKVTAFIEIKARYDEEQNMLWAERMASAGVRIIYSMPGLKVHAKMALVRMNNKKDGKKRLALLSTGNFNEVTARIYADHILMTADKEITGDVLSVFKYLELKVPIPQPERLLISKLNMQERFLKAIDREIRHHREGKPAGIIIKVNALDEKAMINKLYEASQAGVAVQIIVRGMCCLVPGDNELSKNIRVVRLVDKYLEHARVFIFHNAGDSRVWLSSADWMNRNLHHRIEIAFPVLSAEHKATVQSIIQLQLNDTVKLRELDSALNNNRIEPGGSMEIRAQDAIYSLLLEIEALKAAAHKTPGMQEKQVEDSK